MRGEKRFIGIGDMFPGFLPLGYNGENFPTWNCFSGCLEYTSTIFRDLANLLPDSESLYCVTEWEDSFRKMRCQGEHLMLDTGT
jgi:hypothetical protein